LSRGAATLFLLGGTFYETRPGEKREMVERFHADLLRRDAPVNVIDANEGIT
jgi:hypothetical protein